MLAATSARTATALASTSPASGPAPGLFERPRGPGPDRLPRQEASQVVGQLSRRLVASPRLFRHRLQTDGFEVARDLVVEGTGPAGLVVEDLVQHHAGVAA